VGFGNFARPISVWEAAHKQETMLLTIMKSKLHRVRVTQAELNYVGSITIDQDLMEAANLLENEKVQIVNNNNGERFETYVIPGERGSGTICLNGAAARRAQVGDIVIIIAYALMTPEEASTHQPKLVFPDPNNQLVK
jgi:aspartate 1-decarboxylase